ncbi:hypothetical protein V6N11_017859 [Hibiscus sabdariffa]|uniref:Uncharacterized protein n=1 Tax=Hibiscus sabdariffa TaxID=183260 RepID=A0ABR2T5N7_9ROSI
MQVRQRLVSFMQASREKAGAGHLEVARWTPAQVALLPGSSQLNQLPNQFSHRPDHLEVVRCHWYYRNWPISQTFLQTTLVCQIFFHLAHRANFASCILFVPI